MAHLATFVLQILCAIFSIIGLFIWFCETNVVDLLADYGARDDKDTLAVLAMSPLFFFLNATSFIPPKWRDVFRVIAAFFFLNHFELAVCDTKIAFDKLTVNETIDDNLKVTSDAVRLTWAALMLILISSGVSFVTAFLIEPIFIAAYGSSFSGGGSSPSRSASHNKKRRVSKKPSSNSRGNSVTNEPLSLDNNNNNSNTAVAGERATLTITIASPLKVAYILAAMLVIAATAVLVSTGDACSHFNGTDGGIQQLSQTFPAIAFLLMTGSLLNDARALDIAVSMLMMNVVNWQPTDYNIHIDAEQKMLAVSALLQTAGDLVIAFVFIWGIIEARRHKFNYVANMRSTNFKFAVVCWILGFIGGGMVFTSTDNSKPHIWIAAFSGFVVPIFGIGSAVFGAESCFVPAAFVGLRAATHLAENIEGTNGLIRSGWLLLIVSNFGGCMSAIKMFGDPNFVSEEEGTYESIPDAENNNNNDNKKEKVQIKKRNMEELFEWIRGDSRVFTAFLLALVSALSVRSKDPKTHADFVKAMYLAILVVISLAGRDSAGTIVFLAGASYVTTIELWYIDNSTHLTNMTPFIYAGALWMLLLFNRDHFPYLPMHTAFAKGNVIDYSLARNNSTRQKRDNEGERVALTVENQRNNNTERQSNANDGYGAC